jgi:hypothetical protein
MNKRIELEYKGKGRILTVEEFYNRELSMKEFINMTWNECGQDKNFYNSDTSEFADFYDVGAKHIEDCMLGKCSLAETLSSPDKYIQRICDIQKLLQEGEV